MTLHILYVSMTICYSITLLGGDFVIRYGKNAYDAMLGNITESTIEMAVACMSQCTGCMCNCRCSCSGGIIADVEWEVM